MAVLDLNPDLVPTSVLAIKCDVADDVSVRTAVEQVARELGGIDVVVNNAGIGAHGTVADNDDTEWHRVFDINVAGAVRVSRAALPYLRSPPPPQLSIPAPSLPPPGCRHGHSPAARAISHGG